MSRPLKKTPELKVVGSVNNPQVISTSGFVEATSAMVTTVPEVKEEEMTQWIEELYKTINMSVEELNSYWEAFSYKGFNRDNVLKQLRKAIPDPKLASQIIVLIALRGPQAGSQIKLLNGRTPTEMGIPASGGKGTETLTCNKIVAATADLAAAFLKRMNAPKRIDMPLPGWLQFPSAGSIKLPDTLRKQHEEFSKEFSGLIGGVFQFPIYQQMISNSYLDTRLKLFEQ
jgi:hypothetical protein